MQKSIIQVTYRHTIDYTTATGIERNILEATYKEYLLKSQAYNTTGEYTSFTALKKADGRANSLHYKTGFAADFFIAGFKNQMPYLQDVHGVPIVFEKYRFELIESDINDIQKHKIAIYFITGNCTCFAEIANHLLLAYGSHVGDNGPVETFMVPLQPGVNISSVQLLEVNSFSLR